MVIGGKSVMVMGTALQRKYLLAQRHSIAQTGRAGVHVTEQLGTWGSLEEARAGLAD